MADDALLVDADKKDCLALIKLGRLCGDRRLPAGRPFIPSGKLDPVSANRSLPSARDRRRMRSRSRLGSARSYTRQPITTAEVDVRNALGDVPNQLAADPP